MADKKDTKMAKCHVQVVGRKKNATALALCRSNTTGRGMIKINGRPLDLFEPQTLQLKLQEPILLIGGRDPLKNLDIKVRVKGGGQVAQIYAARQAIAKAIVAYSGKFVSETERKDLKETFMHYDKTLLVADPRRCEPKKFGGPGARARYQKSYR